MTLPLPSFLRRRLLLHEARRALLAGEPVRALDLLDDACLAHFEAAEPLRARTVEVLCLEAERLAGEGQRASAARLLERLESESAALARAWRRRLGLSLAGNGVESGVLPQGALAQGEGRAVAPSSAAGGRIAGAMGNLLAELRGAAGARAGPAEGPSGEHQPQQASAPAAAPPRRPGATLLFHLAVDEAGELLFARGERLVVGHASGGLADLPLLGDVDAEHLLLARGESFHGGPTWRVVPLSRPVLRGGVELSSAGSELHDGDLLRLAPRVALCFRRPEPASGSALLELLHGLECEGASRVVLMAEGPAGRVRMGPRLGRHVLVPGMPEDVELWSEGSELIVRSAALLEVRGWDPQPGTDSAQVRLPCPPPARIDVRIGAPVAGRPPYGFALRGVGPASSSGVRR